MRVLRCCASSIAPTGAACCYAAVDISDDCGQAPDRWFTPRKGRRRLIEICLKQLSWGGNEPLNA